MFNIILAENVDSYVGVTVAEIRDPMFPAVKGAQLLLLSMRRTLSELCYVIVVTHTTRNPRILILSLARGIGETSAVFLECHHRFAKREVDGLCPQLILDCYNLTQHIWRWVRT
jgi:hypothetical protein